MFLDKEPWREELAEQRSTRKAEYAAAVDELKELRAQQQVAARRAARRGDDAEEAMQAVASGHQLPHYAMPKGDPAVVRLPALHYVRQGVMPPPLTPTPTDFELLTHGASRHTRFGPGDSKGGQHRDGDGKGGKSPTKRRGDDKGAKGKGSRRSPSRGRAAEPEVATTVHIGRSRTTIKKTDIDGLALSAPGKYIAAKIALVRSDATEFTKFTSEMDDVEDQIHRDRAQRAHEQREALEAARIPVDPEVAAARERERQQHAAERHDLIKRETLQRRQEAAERTLAKQDQSIEVRTALQTGPLRAKQWALKCFLVKSVAGFLMARRSGYRRRWVRLLVVYIARHWMRRTERRRDTFDTLRVNLFIRKNLPAMVEAFRMRRCVAAAPLLRRFLKQYTSAMTFTLQVRLFSKQVRIAQRIARKRRFIRTIMMGALRAAWDRQVAVMRAESTLLLEIPDKLRDVVLWKLYLAEAAAFGCLRHHLVQEWRQMRDIHADLIKLRVQGVNYRERQGALLNATSAHGVDPWDDHVGSAKDAFVDRMFSGARAFFEADPAKEAAARSATSSDPNASPVTSVDEAYLMGDWAKKAGRTRERKGGEPSAAVTAKMQNALEMSSHMSDHKIVRQQTHADRVGQPAGRVAPKPALHPSMRFGANKGQPQSSAPADSAASPTDSALGSESGVKAAVASGKSRLPSKATSTASPTGRPDSSPLGSHLVRRGSMHHTSPTQQPKDAKKAGNRRKSLHFSLPPPEMQGATAGGTSQPVTEDYLLNGPDLPRRKLLTRPAVMAAVAVAARDAIYGGMRRRREEQRVLQEQAPAHMDDVSAISSATATPQAMSANESPSTTPRQNALSPPRGAPAAAGGGSGSPARTGQRGGKRPNDEEFIVPPEFDTTDEAFLARYIDFSWVSLLVTRVSPSYGTHGPVPNTAAPSALSQVHHERKADGDGAAEADPHVPEGATTRRPTLVKSASFRLRGGQRGML